MKLFYLLSSFALAASAWAAPAPQAREQILAIYKLRIISDDPGLNGTYINRNDNEDDMSIGIYNGGSEASAYLFYIDDTSPPPGNNYELFSYPIGTSQQLVLVGQPGFLQMAELFPAATLLAEGTVLQYQQWTITPARVGRRRARLLGYRDRTSSYWVAFPTTDGWKVYWYDGSVIVTQNYMRIQLEVVPA